MANGTVATIAIISSAKREKKLNSGDIEKDLMNYIYNLREVGAIVNSKLTIAAARRIVKGKDEEILKDYGNPYGTIYSEIKTRAGPV